MQAIQGYTALSRQSQEGCPRLSLARIFNALQQGLLLGCPLLVSVVLEQLSLTCSLVPSRVACTIRDPNGPAAARHLRTLGEWGPMSHVERASKRLPVSLLTEI